MEYFLIILSVVMFGGCFAFQDVYRRYRGANGIKMTFETLFIGSVGGLIILLIANCLSLENGISFDISGLNQNDRLTPFVGSDGNAPTLPCCSHPDFKLDQKQLELYKELLRK